ncbi:MAG TPA: sigma-70 family RNA polymerase sigma factor [Planctomycetota bacterium]|nr:sigma-70 family RNA polymerase sigma factor [Planctomycetota bacterium]
MDEDRELVKRLIAGKSEAWDQFGRDFCPLIIRACAYYLKRKMGVARPPDVENALQQVLFTLFQGDRRVLKSFQWKSRLSTWLVAVSHRVCSKLLRSEARHPNPIPTDILQEILEGNDGEKSPTRPYGIDEVWAGLGRLPRRDALLVKLIYYDGMSQKEAADMLGLSPASVPTLLARAKDRLRAILKSST